MNATVMAGAFIFAVARTEVGPVIAGEDDQRIVRSEEHTSELQSHSFISYAVFCLKKKNILTLHP